MASRLLIWCLAAWVSQASGQSVVGPMLSVRDQAHLADQVNLELGREIVAPPRGDYEVPLHELRGKWPGKELRRVATRGRAARS